MLSKLCFLDQQKNSYMELLIHSGVNILYSIIRMIPLTAMIFIWNSKDTTDGNSNLRHQKYSLTYTTVLGFVACRVTSKIPGIGSAERSWGDVKTIKSGTRSAPGSDISEKQSIVYTSACIEEERIGRSLSRTYTNNGSHSHTCNDGYQAFDYQLDQWGVDKLFPNEDEAITRELKTYMEEWEKTHIKNNSQV